MLHPIAWAAMRRSYCSGDSFNGSFSGLLIFRHSADIVKGVPSDVSEFPGSFLYLSCRNFTMLSPAIFPEVQVKPEANPS